MEKSRKLYKYQTVRYFLGANTDEFLNVGVLLIDEVKLPWHEYQGFLTGPWKVTLE